MSAEKTVVYLTRQTSLLGLKVFARHSQQPAYAFLGVPYAEPPKRFAAPCTLKLWNGERDATKFGAICPQNKKRLSALIYPIVVSEEMSEDCLLLNIWTPTLDTATLRPVMVWIHGGAYAGGCGNSSDGTAYACNKDVVFVSINYRVGILGFLYTGDEAAPGNMAFLDQREALRWIQSYIHCFGGDAKNVTVFGESAGGMSISCHMVSPDSYGLFHRAILQSGSSCYYKSVISPSVAKRRLANLVEKLGGNNIKDGQDVVRFLDGPRLAKLIQNPPHSLLYPVVDGNFLPDHPLHLFAAGRFTKVDAIFGFNTDDGYDFFAVFCRTYPRSLTADTAKDILRTIICDKYFAHHPNANQICNIVWNRFLNGVTDPNTLFQRLSQIWGDILMIVPTVCNTMLHSKKPGAGRTYLFQLDHRPSYSPFPDWVTARHGDDIPFVLGEPFIDRLPNFWADEEIQLSDSIMTYWASFAKHGNPNSSEVKLFWPTFQHPYGSYITLRPTSTIGDSYCTERMDFWLNDIGQRLVPFSSTSIMNNSNKL